MNILFNTIGILGVGLVTFAYLLQQLGKLTMNDYRYLYLNLLGAIALAISLMWNWNLPSFVIQCAWVIITIYGILKKHKYDL